MYHIGVDLGGTNIAAGIVDSTGKILAKKSVLFVMRHNHEELAEDIVNLCKDLAVETSISLEIISSIGIGVPGVVSPKNGMVMLAGNLGVEDMPISHLVGQVLKIPVFIENDANCAALAEATFGAASGSRNSITITLGTGVGGGIIIDGKIYSGAFFGAGEMHQVIRGGGVLCQCGRQGCWEAYASAGGLVRELRQLGVTDKTTAKDIFDAAHSGDILAQQAVDAYTENLCIGLGNLVNILQPEICVIGGGISGQGQGFIDSIKNRMPRMVLGVNRDTKYAIAALGNDAGIIGAAMLGISSE